MGQCFVRGCNKFTEIGVGSIITGLKIPVCDDHVDGVRRLVDGFDDNVTSLIRELWGKVRSLSVEKKGD